MSAGPSSNPGSEGSQAAGALLAPPARSNGNGRYVESSPLAGAEASGDTGITGLVRTIKRRQGIFLFTFAIVTGALAVNTLRQRIFSPVYQGGFQLQISNPFDTGSSGPVNAAQGDRIEALARSSPKNDVPSLMVLMRSPLLLRPLAEKTGVPLGEISSNLSISPTSETVQNVLNVNLLWRDPAKGRAILTQLADDYTKFSMNQRQAALDSGIRFLERQAPDILTKVERLQREMLRFREANNFIDPATTASTILSTREGLVSQLRALQTEQVQLDSQIASVRSGKLQWNPSGAPTALQQLGRFGVLTPGRGPAIEESAATAAGRSTPLDQLNEFEQQLATLRATYKESSPLIQSIKAKRDSLLPVVQKQALDNLLARLLANVAQQDEINRQILLLNENFRSSPQRIRQYGDLEQRLSVARDNYNSYIRARENFRLELARYTTPWQVISPAEFADIPVEPNIQKSLMRAVLIGLLAGLAAALIRERTDNVFHTPMEAESNLQLPVLGLIPYLPLEPGVEISTSLSKMSASERFAIKESLRSLFTTFRLLRADRSIRLVGVTSSTQGEGKSTAVTVFARTLADLGLRVLVIDADMRLPMQNRYLGIESGEGFSTVLSDPTKSVSSFIQTIQDNLDILPAGPKPPDPAKLLNSNRCQAVVDQVRALDHYDIVLWDAPPCLMLADPILLGEKLDGILFLVGLGKVSKELAPQACRRIKATGVDVLGLICNQVNFPTRLNDYGYEYGYYYHYAYASNYAKSAGGYGRGLTGYLRRYRDSYMRKGSYGDSYLGRRSGSGYFANRYIRDGYAVQGYQKAATEQDRQPSTRAGSARSQGPGPLGWLRQRLPGGRPLPRPYGRYDSSAADGTPPTGAAGPGRSAASSAPSAPSAPSDPSSPDQP
ncbi:MAG: polysaccharide biosynthesis tyrosine autokinase [Synechococcaceae cyanobacterium]|nr:polysaccharide biosynthesis tyrosine autokinase [Synechococcaceae cyanobacterium]